LAHWTMSGAPPDSVRCTRTYNSKPATLGNLETRSAIIHRTVWCATGLSSEPAKQRLSTPTVNSANATVRNSAKSEVRAQKSERTELSGVAPDGPVQLEDKRLQRSTAQNHNGWVTWQRTRLSGAPIANSLTNVYGSGWEL
jgi:hypothetical protein